MDETSGTSAPSEIVAETEPGEAALAIGPSRQQRADTRPSVTNEVLRGWGTASLSAVLAFGAAGLLAEAVVSFSAIAGRSPASSEVLAKTGGLLFLAFHHVGLLLSPPGTPAGLAQFGLIGGLDVTVSMAILLGTACVGWLLWLGGRAVGERADGPAWMRGLHGAKLALPYAAMCFGLSFLLGFSVNVAARVQLGLASQSVSVSPNRAAAFVWPLAIGLVAGFAGGASSRNVTHDARLVGALHGAWAMLLWGLGLSFAGLLVLAVAKPDLTRSYVGGMFGGGPAQGFALFGLDLLVVPNMAAWVLFPSMGACVGGAVSFSSALSSGSLSRCLVSYSSLGLPGGLSGIKRMTVLGGLPLSPPAKGYFLFLLVPLAATLIGGRAAARRAGAAGRKEGALEGALAGLVFAALALGLAALSQIVLGVHPSSPSAGGALGTGGEIRVGPYLVETLAVGLAWGVAGGAIGGLLARPTGTPGPAWQPAAGEPVEATEPQGEIAAGVGLPEGPPDALGL